MSELRKPFLRKSDQKNKKNTENQCKNAACEQKTTSEKLKFNSNKKNRPRMSCEWIGETM